MAPVIHSITIWMLLAIPAVAVFSPPLKSQMSVKIVHQAMFVKEEQALQRLLVKKTIMDTSALWVTTAP